MAPRREDTIVTEDLPTVHSDIRDYYRNVCACIQGKEEIKVKLPEVMRVMRLMEAILNPQRRDRLSHLNKNCESPPNLVLYGGLFS